MSPRAVAIIHREPLVAESIAAAVGRFPGILPVGVATTAEGAEALAGQADAAILDSELPGAVSAAGALRRRGVRVVFVGDPPEDDEGLHVATTGSVADLAIAVAPHAAPLAGRRRLTPREREILSLVARGMAGKQVARHLGISPKTVEHHKTRIFAKLGVRNQAGAVGVAVSHGSMEGARWSPSSI